MFIMGRWHWSLRSVLQLEFFICTHFFISGGGRRGGMDRGRGGGGRGGGGYGGGGGGYGGRGGGGGRGRGGGPMRG